MAMAVDGVGNVKKWGGVGGVYNTSPNKSTTWVNGVGIGDTITVEADINNGRDDVGYVE